MALPSFYMNGDWKLPSYNGYVPSYKRGFLNGDSSKGLPRIRKDYENEPVLVQANYSMMTERDLQVFFAFFYGAIRQGQRRFYAKLDVSGELQTYVCQLEDISASGWTGYSATIQMKMWVVVDKNINNTTVLGGVRYVEPPYVDEQYVPTSY